VLSPLLHPVTAGLAVQGVFVGVAVALAMLAPARWRSVLAGSACALLGAAGAATGALALSGRRGALEIPTVLSQAGEVPGLDPLRLAPDRLGGAFLVLAGAVGVLVSIYGIGYARQEVASRSAWAALAAFLFGMQAVAAAADAVSFLLAWEVMALASTAGVLIEHRQRPRTTSAGLWYAAMTHVSFLLLLAGFAVLSVAGGGTGFSAMATVDPASAAGSAAFLLLLTGAAAKAGLVPLHVWLPLAHPEAPGHFSAAMSAAMVKLGLYVALLVCVRLLPGGPGWWGAGVAAVGAVSAVYGVLQASVATDLKRLLAYSTTENLGLMFLALGCAVLLRAHGNPAAADAALAACLLLAAGHAVAKATLFAAAGSVLHGTGERDLDRLGGLGRRMPWTRTAFGVAALGAAALPVTAGFTGEWMLLQALIHGGRAEPTVAVVMPGAIAVVALTTGLAVLTFVKAYGTAFLGRPRSAGAAEASEASAGRVPMRLAVAGGAGSVVALGLAPGPVVAVLAGAVMPAGQGGREGAGVWMTQWAGVQVPGLAVRLEPLALAATAAAACLPVLVVAALAARRHPRRHTTLAWGCGGARLSPRMQYTATSYAEPLVRVFDDALRPTQDVVVTHAVESAYVVRRMRFRQRLTDVVEASAYRPVIAAADRVGTASRRMQNGSIHRYLTYSFVALLAVLLGVTW
jgi:hydrogenase-4 component B